MRYYFSKPKAYAKIGGQTVSGTVKFYQLPGGVLVEADITGLPENRSGFYGFHIHAGEACKGSGFAATGSHYDPANRPHPQHAGDLPPLLARRGRAYLAVVTDRFSLADVVGRTVVIHGQADDFYSQPAGNAGDKIACGVIHWRQSGR